MESKKKRVLLILSGDLLEQVDKVALGLELSRLAFIRQALINGVATNAKRIRKRFIDFYTETTS